MYLDQDWPGPRPEPPRKPDKRATNAATVLILLICSVALGAPIAGGTLVAMVMAVARLW